MYRSFKIYIAATIQKSTTNQAQNNISLPDRILNSLSFVVNLFLDISNFFSEAAQEFSDLELRQLQVVKTLNTSETFDTRNPIDFTVVCQL